MEDRPSSTDVIEQEVMVYECGYEPAHEHHLPSDWQFGGADGLDPRSDPRWIPSTYVYFDARLQPVHLTQVPFCDDEAIDGFTQVLGDPVWITVRRPGESVSTTLPVTYNSKTDEVFETEE